MYKDEIYLLKEDNYIVFNLSSYEEKPLNIDYFAGFVFDEWVYNVIPEGALVSTIYIHNIKSNQSKILLKIDGRVEEMITDGLNLYIYSSAVEDKIYKYNFETEELSIFMDEIYSLTKSCDMNIWNNQICITSLFEFDFIYDLDTGDKRRIHVQDAGEMDTWNYNTNLVSCGNYLYAPSYAHAGKYRYNLLTEKFEEIPEEIQKRN